VCVCLLIFSCSSRSHTSSGSLAKGSRPTVGFQGFHDRIPKRQPTKALRDFPQFPSQPSLAVILPFKCKITFYRLLKEHFSETNSVLQRFSRAADSRSSSPKFSCCCGTGRFMTVITKACHQTLSQFNSVHSFTTIPLASVLILSTSPRLNLRNGFFLETLKPECVCLSCSPIYAS
jgi:hypothetical protein